MRSFRTLLLLLCLSPSVWAGEDTLLCAARTGRFTVDPRVPPAHAGIAVERLGENWGTYYDVPRVGMARTEGSFAIAYQHSGRDGACDRDFVTVILRSDLAGETLPPAIAREVEARSGEGCIFPREEATAYVSEAYSHLYRRYDRQAAQRRNVVARYRELDERYASRTTHFLTIYRGRVVGHTQIQFSRSSAEPLNMEIYGPLPRVPPGMHVEVGRVMLHLPPPADRRLREYVTFLQYRLAFGYALWDLGANQVHFEVTEAGLKVFQSLSPLRFETKVLETDNGPLTAINMSRNFALFCEETLQQRLMHWRLARFLESTDAVLPIRITRSEREVWLRLGWLTVVGDRDLEGDETRVTEHRGWLITRSAHQSPGIARLAVDRATAGAWHRSLGAVLEEYDR